MYRVGWTEKVHPFTIPAAFHNNGTTYCRDLHSDLIDETRFPFDKMQDHQPMPRPSLVDEKTPQHCYLPSVQIVSVRREPRHLRTYNDPQTGSTVSEIVAIGL